MWASHLLKTLQHVNKEHFLSVMPVHGEKFHGLAKNFFGLPRATSAVFHPPIRLRIQAGVL
jgi:hypothetical protein